MKIYFTIKSAALRLSHQCEVKRSATPHFAANIRLRVMWSLLACLDHLNNPINDFANKKYSSKILQNPQFYTLQHNHRNATTILPLHYIKKLMPMKLYTKPIKHVEDQTFQ